jgi:predicted TIM-barrel fold metal-dependent hydrolase
MRRPKPSSRRPKAAKKAPKKRHVVGTIEMTAPPTRAQLAALKKAFGTRRLSTVGITRSTAVTTVRTSFRKPSR